MMTRWWVPAAFIAALALAASANSVVNGFTYDDVELIARSSRMHSLDGWWREFARTYWPERSGGDGYRPLTILAFRLEWVLGGGQPAVFHAVNIGLHILTAVAVFWLAVAVLPFGAAWIAAALYAVHPVHVEAIANVVGQSELAVALLVTLATGLYIHGRRAGALSWRRWCAIVCCFVAALLFKEHAILLPLLLLIGEATVVSDRTAWKRKVATLRLPYLVLALVAVMYLWVRSTVVISGLAGFKPFAVFQALDLSTGHRVLTMIGAAHEWLRLLLWPARLMTEYSPPYIDIAQGPSVSQLPGLLVLVGILGLLIACWRRSPVTSFGLGWVVLTLLPSSNFIVPAGFIIAERTLLLPSVGAMLAVGSVIPPIFARIEHQRVLRRLSAAVVVLLLALGLGRSVTRNSVWRDNETLFRQSVADAPDSYRAHFMLGVYLFDHKRRAEGEAHYREAMRLFPYDPVMAYAMAEQYRGAGLCNVAIPFYRALFELAPTANRGYNGLAACLLMTGRPIEARQLALAGIRAGANVTRARELIDLANQARIAERTVGR